jgi:hypothetical protein
MKGKSFPYGDKRFHAAQFECFFGFLTLQLGRQEKALNEYGNIILAFCGEARFGRTEKVFEGNGSRL